MKRAWPRAVVMEVRGQSLFQAYLEDRAVGFADKLSVKRRKKIIQDFCPEPSTVQGNGTQEFSFKTC